MPSIIDHVLLGIVQGLTELLPISSSGHLVLCKHLLGVDSPGLLLEIVLHLGTLVAVCWAFRQDLARVVSGLLGRDADGRRLGGCLVLATLPVVVLGVPLKSTVENAFQSPAMAAAMLLVTGVMLLSTRAVRDARQPLGWRRALVMGLAQVVALLPGISRSGTTITAGIWSRLERRQAARFSFLMSIPAVLGAALVEVVDLEPSSLAASDAAGLSAGFLASVVASFAAIHLLFKLIDRNRFEWFGIYCLVVGALTLVLLGRA
ncbi:MAG: undecaprenyl-diphosphate phosphatase [Candidatus Eiseniibacteriota bacterium]|jgi:undecaprenyl-diphosphatase